MNREIEKVITFGNFGNEQSTMEMDASEELDWLMSLALDNALDAEEAERFEALLQQDNANLNRWTSWQALDSAFHEVPMVVPSPDFGEKFAQRLEIQERQRRLRTGAIFGLAAISLWGSALVGIFILAAMIWSNQSSLVGGLIQNVGYWWIAVQHFGRALINTGEALLSAPQTRALAVCYLALVAAILASWFAFLRRSTREMPLAEGQLVEA